MSAHTLLRRSISGLLLASAAVLATPASAADDGSLTWNGVTLYGTVDLALSYQTNGTPASDYHPAVTEAMINKNSNGSVTALTANQLTPSRVGLKGSEPIGDGWSGVFKVETFFNPQSGQIADALHSLVLNNGVALAAQKTGADSSIAGQFFNSAAYVGVSNAEVGTITIGRQSAVSAELMTAYDPMGGAQGFAPIGWSGTYGGAGDTEDKRLDGSIKYDGNFKGFHLAAIYQPTNSTNLGTSAQLAVGYNFGKGAVEAVYSEKHDALFSSSLSAAQVTDVAQVCAGTASAAVAAAYACAPLSKALAGTAADTKTSMVVAKYKFSPRLTSSAGWEHMEYDNPSVAAHAGQETIGGYTLVNVNNNAYPLAKKVDVYWAGGKFQATERTSVAVAYYYIEQNSYATGAHAGCSTTVAGSCSGSMNALSFLAVQQYSKRFAVYEGAMYSAVQGGMASGFLATSTVNPTVGFRYSF